MKALSKEYKIRAPKQRVFEALTQPDLIAEWSGEAAEMDNNPGGDFSLWGGDVFGVNLEVSPDKIVQDWQDSNWEKPSKVVFTLTENSGTTILKVLHKNIPDRAFIGVNIAWDEDYVKPLKELVEEY
jgi:uncharacterized protein YndB with AHSA1/START domain